MQGRGDTNVLGLFGSFALGAGLMYALDPVRGRRRRAVTRDKLFSAVNQFQDAAGKTSVDLWNRSRGLVSHARGAFTQDQPGDEVVCARVRSKMGRMISHPHAIRVDAQD